MDRSTVKKLIKLLGGKNVVDRSEWVGFSCPFARWTHDSGTDNHPSAGISVGDNSWFSCFTCGQKHPIYEFPAVWREITGKENSDLNRFILCAGRGKITYRGDSISSWDENSILPTVLSSRKFVGLFEEIDVNIRNLNKKTRETYRLRWDEAEQRLIIPIINKKGEIIGIKGRALRPTDKLRHKFYSDLFKHDPKRFGVWFGMHLPLRKGKAIVLTEGEIDVMKLHQHGVHNAWGCMGTGISKAQVTTLVNTAKPYVFFFDDDKAGHQLADKLIRELHGLVPLYRVMNYCGCKDADELFQKGLLNKALHSIRKVL